MVCVALWEGRETSAECRVTKDWADELKREWGGGGAGKQMLGQHVLSQVYSHFMTGLEEDSKV